MPLIVFAYKPLPLGLNPHNLDLHPPSFQVFLSPSFPHLFFSLEWRGVPEYNVFYFRPQKFENFSHCRKRSEVAMKLAQVWSKEGSMAADQNDGCVWSEATPHDD